MGVLFIQLSKLLAVITVVIEAFTLMTTVMRLSACLSSSSSAPTPARSSSCAPAPSSQQQRIHTIPSTQGAGLHSNVFRLCGFYEESWAEFAKTNICEAAACQCQPHPALGKDSVRPR